MSYAWAATTPVKDEPWGGFTFNPVARIHHFIRLLEGGKVIAGMIGIALSALLITKKVEGLLFTLCILILAFGGLQVLNIIAFCFEKPKSPSNARPPTLYLAPYSVLFAGWIACTVLAFLLRYGDFDASMYGTDAQTGQMEKRRYGFDGAELKKGDKGGISETYLLICAIAATVASVLSLAQAVLIFILVTTTWKPSDIETARSGAEK